MIPQFRVMFPITEFIRHINPKEQAAQRYTLNVQWFRKYRNKENEPPYYLINTDQVAPRRFSLDDVKSGVKKGVAALLAVLAVIGGVTALYERTNRPSLNLTLDQTSSGYFFRVVNSGRATATSVKVELESWPIGAPGTWRWSFPARDIPAQSDSVIPMELVPSSLPESDQRKMLESLSNSVLSGYVMVTCNNCSESKNWAFSFPGYQTSAGRNYARSLPPLVPVSTREDRPPRGSCVDFPTGVCGDFSTVWIWTPKKGR